MEGAYPQAQARFCSYIPVKPRNEKPAWNGLREFWVCRAGGQTGSALLGGNA